MNGEIKIFSSERFGDARTAGTSEEPLFCLADVCKAIGIVNARNVKERLDGDDVRLMDTIDSLGRTQQATFVTESGLYDVIIRSDSENAKPFRKWVTSEVLPSIRKTGGYITAKADETDADIMARALIVAQETLKRRDERIKALETEREQDKPKVAFANAIEASKSSCLIGELAKILTQNGYTIGQNRLFEWMRNNGYLGTKGERYNIPNQQYVEQGLFELKKGVRSGNDGVMHTTITPKITGKGQSYFINKFLNA